MTGPSSDGLSPVSRVMAGLPPADDVVRVLADVAAERGRQDRRWGEQNHPDGTGDAWDQLQAGIAKATTDDLARRGCVTWRDILLEEVREALAESDPARLRVELVQVAAVATQWVEAIDRRRS